MLTSDEEACVSQQNYFKRCLSVIKNKRLQQTEDEPKDNWRGMNSGKPIQANMLINRDINSS